MDSTTERQMTEQITTEQLTTERLMNERLMEFLLFNRKIFPIILNCRIFLDISRSY